MKKIFLLFVVIIFLFFPESSTYLKKNLRKRHVPSSPTKIFFIGFQTSAIKKKEKKDN